MALLTFKSSLEDPSNRLSSWQEGSQHKNCCSWHGIGCSYDTFHVVSIDLRNVHLENYMDEAMNGEETVIQLSSSLTGKLSPSLFNLTHLEYLDLAFNDFHNLEPEILFRFSELTKLTHLDLSNTNFTSSISTHFGNLSSLVYLDLSCKSISYFHGDYFPFPYIPTFCLNSSSTQWMRGLVNLQVLRLSGIDLSDQATSSKLNFAHHIPYLSNLRKLDISNCRIYDPIRHKFHNLSRLVSLKMGGNFFNSLIPLQLANLTALITLELPSCGLYQGSSIPYLPQLKEIDVSDNPYLHTDLTRMFPSSWPKLQKLQISSTNATGYIPSSNAPQLVSFSASGCSIQGSSVPFSFYNLSLLQYLDLSNNNITSNLSSISSLKKLHFLDLSHNNFQGPIPSSICKKFLLRQLFLDSNNITGVLPSCITMLKNLVDIRISNNAIRGTVSLISLISKFKLTSLDLSSTKLTIDVDERVHLYSKPTLETLKLGKLHPNVFPTFSCNLTHLKQLNLSHSNLMGPIPSCISELKNLLYLDLSNNKLRGPLPVLPQGIYHLDLSQNKLDGEISLKAGERISSAREISLNGNKLSGTIPFSICSPEPRKTYDPVFIDLSKNKLSGTIPSSIGSCSLLWYLNLGNNNLSGNVPNELQQVERLQYLQLSHNNLNGTFPKSIEKLYSLQGLDLGYNNFEGNIPSGFGSPTDLRIISLRSNKFNGSIPIGIYNTFFLQILDLSINNFSGPISREITKLMMLKVTTTLYLSRTQNGKMQFQLAIKGSVAQFDDLYEYSSGIDLSCNILDGKFPQR
ncbi:LRR receptor-like serine/threonine-protein kinase FLS2 [Papaver somniferum]|uniref:LRR receptor-like serine/threonine-protein kinase FLS2 n=1 Tax=Papaver somniferum TaxID=3469 RepID=UPI000E6F7EA3|nr:LRR receptor-like serine/threonine-protein kinase FLS2 [Papaver somniferum]